MSKTSRAIIFYIFLLLFIISAPVLILYTSGYRYNFRHGRIEQLGALIIKSTPRDARIKLNGREIKEQTPAFLKVLPDEYRIEVLKEGYNGWIKNLRAQSRETTFAENIILWKISEPERVISNSREAGAVNIYFSKDLRFVIVLNKTANEEYEIIAHDFSLRREKFSFGIVSQNLPKISFSKSNDSVLIETIANSKDVFYVARLPEATYSKIDIANFENLKWGETDSAVYGWKNGKLFSINLYNERVDSIARAGREYLLRDTTVWSISNENSVPTFQKNEVGNVTAEPQSIFELPQGSYKFLEIESPFFLLQNTNPDQLLLINTRSINDGAIVLHGKNALLQTNKNGEREILHSNDFEIWRTNINTKNTELVRRQSEKINNVSWYLQEEYIIFSSKNKIEAIELDSRDSRNITTLLDNQNFDIDKFLIDSQGRAIYFGVLGTGGGVYRLEL